MNFCKYLVISKNVSSSNIFARNSSLTIALSLFFAVERLINFTYYGSKSIIVYHKKYLIGLMLILSAINKANTFWRLTICLANLLNV